MLCGQSKNAIISYSRAKNIAINAVLEKDVGVNMVELDYVSEKYLIFHDYYGLFIYNLVDSEIYRTLNLGYYDMGYINGDNVCEVYVSNDYVYLHNNNEIFRYDIYNNLMKNINSNAILNLKDDKLKMLQNINNIFLIITEMKENLVLIHIVMET